MPNLSDFTKKIDLQGIVDSVKSAIGSQTAPAKAPAGDEIAAKFVELITSVQGLVNEHAEHTKSLAALSQKLNALYKDVQAFRNASTPGATCNISSPSAAPETKEDKG